MELSNDKKTERTLINLFCGNVVDISYIFDIEEKRTISFSKKEYLEKRDELVSLLGLEKFEVIDAAKSLYDSLTVKFYLKDSPFYCYMKSDLYDKHKYDLDLLKCIIKEYCKNDYSSVFRSTKAGSYSSYVNSTNSGGKVTRRKMGGQKNRSTESFYGNIKSLLKDYDDERIRYIMREIENESFMPKQRTTDNSIIPNYIYERELTTIIDNASKYLLFLNDIDESGYSIKEKIISLFTFNIPFYVGPVTELSHEYGGNGWVKRKETGTVYPWNFNDKIDEEECLKRYILNMVNNCTYLKSEKTEPACSILYQEFRVLDEINNIKIDGINIDVSIKQDIFNELYKKKEVVLRKDIIDFLIDKGYAEFAEQITGLDREIKNQFSTYNIFKDILGSESFDIEWVDELVYNMTVLHSSKVLLKKKIEELCDNRVSKNVVNSICDIKNIRGWGRVSRKLLLLKDCDDGESIIDRMWKSNVSFIECVTSSRFEYKNLIIKENDINNYNIFSISFDDIYDPSMTNASNKVCWQVVLIIRDIVRVMGSYPQNIILESNRFQAKKGEKGREPQQNIKLKRMFAKVPNRDYWEKEIDRAYQEGLLTNRRMKLYFLQLGQDVYTGLPIDIMDVLNENIYDIDHIYPQSVIKDEDINNNLVLVKKQKNAKKTSEYPLSENIRKSSKVRDLWKKLRNYNLMTVEKYARLVGTKPISNEQKEQFLRRQLVETSQSAIQVKQMLERILKRVDIILVKANEVSYFRQKFEFPKTRLVNDFHHAHDAYLNIVVGNVFYTKFGLDLHWFIYNSKQQYNLEKMYDKDIIASKRIGWISGDNGTIKVVKNVMSKNTPLLTRQSFIGHGAIADEMIVGNDKAKNGTYLPIKTRDKRMWNVEKYGGYSSASTAYFFLVEHLIKGKRIRTIESVPIYLINRIGHDKNELERYCLDKLSLIDAKVIIPIIKLQSLFKINGYYMHISAKWENRISYRNSVQMCLDDKWVKYIAYLEHKKDEEYLNKDANQELYMLLASKHKNTIYSRKPTPMGEVLLNGYEIFCSFSLEEQCQILKQILMLSKIGITEANLTALGGGKRSGIMKVHKNISNVDSVG